VTDTDRPAVIDEATFAEIWSEHADAVTARLRALGAGSDAEDLCQDVFLAAWAKRDQYDPARGPVIAWLFVRARSVAIDHFRAAGRRPSTVDISDGFEAADGADVAAQVCDQAEVAELLAQVPERDREVVARRYLADQPVAAAAQDLGMSPGTVKARCHKAIAVLRTALDVVAPIAPRTPDPTPAVEPVTAPAAARSTTVAVPDPAPPTHRRRPRRPRMHFCDHRCPVPATDRRGSAHPP
jgi:RNA polymerase sigma-70 factor (ECF subfamily)